MKCFIDLETRSPVSIKAGTGRYAEDAEIILWAYALDDGPISVWDVAAGDLMPADLADALENPDCTFVAHNAQFEASVLKAQGYDIARWFCTMNQALAHALPPSLGQLSEVFKLPTDKAKDKRGRELIKTFCSPHKGVYRDADSHPAEWREFIQYCGQDVEAMRAVAAKMPRWNCTKAEQALFDLDMTINLRGIAVDLDLAQAAVAAVEREQARLAVRASELTNGAVRAASQREALRGHLLAEHGLDLADMRKGTVTAALQDPDLPDNLRELLETRLSASATASAKFKVFIQATNSDGRLRCVLRMNGAMRTGRWAGRTIQPQNFARGTIHGAELDAGIAALKAGVADLTTENVMELASSAVRGCIVAPPERKLVVADLAAIEGRVLAWLAGEGWALDAYRDFDTVRLRDGSWMSGPSVTAARLARLPVHIATDLKGDPIRKGGDFYKLTYAQAFRVPVERVGKQERAIGKVLVLSMGYGGGVGGFVTFANAYGMDLEAMAEEVEQTIDPAIRKEAASMLQWMRETARPVPDVSDRVFIVCDSLKRLWRAANPETVNFWAELENACRAAIQAKATVKVRRLVVDTKGAYLRIRLPSGRYLTYPAPRVDDAGGISFYGKNQFNARWTRIESRGSRLVENATQAVARDILASSTQPLEDAGYQIVLSVHDELLAETPDTEEFNAEHMSAIMSVPPKWGSDMPLAAEGFETTRYRK